MKFVRLIILSGIVFFVLACIVSFFIPSHIRVFRMVHLAKGRDSVLNQVRDLSEWKNWYPGFQDIQLKDVQTENGKVVKAIADDILLQITRSDSNTVAVEIRKGNRPVVAGWQIDKGIKEDSLALQGYMDFNLKWYPWEKFSSLLLDRSYGESLMQGLQRLKE